MGRQDRLHTSVFFATRRGKEFTNLKDPWRSSTEIRKERHQHEGTRETFRAPTHVSASRDVVMMSFYPALLMQTLSAKIPVRPDAECLFEPEAQEHTPVATAHADEPE